MGSTSGIELFRLLVAAISTIIGTIAKRFKKTPLLHHCYTVSTPSLHHRHTILHHSTPLLNVLFLFTVIFILYLLLSVVLLKLVVATSY